MASIQLEQVLRLDPITSPTVDHDFIKYHTQNNGKHGGEHQHTLNTSIMAPCHITSMIVKLAGPFEATCCSEYDGDMRKAILQVNKRDDLEK
jgi:hypothetical protein